MDEHAGHDHGPPPAAPQAAPAPAADAHAGHDHGLPPAPPQTPPAPAADAHAGHDHGPATAPEADAHAGHGLGAAPAPAGTQGAAAPHADGHATSFLDEPEAALLAKTCEHGTATVRCAKCRPETGAVAVRPAIVCEPDAQTSGLIHLGRVHRRTVTTALEAPGRVELDEGRTCHIASRVQGLIHDVRVDLGSAVRAGDVLLFVESMEAAEVVSGRARAQAALALAERTYRREQDLATRKISSEREYSEAQSALRQAQIEIQAADRKLALLGVRPADLDASAEVRDALQQGRVPLRSPIGGTVVFRHAVQGEYAEPGKDIFVVADLSQVWVWAEVYEADVDKLLTASRNGKPRADVRVKSFPMRVFTGVVDYVDTTVDRRTRTIRARVALPNPDHLLRAGMYGDVRIHLGVETILAAPASSILFDGSRAVVFKKLEAGLFLERAVKVGRTFDTVCEIADGVRDGDWVAAEGAFLLKSEALRSKMGAG